MRIRKPTLQKIKRLLDPRVAKVLSYMRRTGASLSKAAHRERIKPDTLVKKAGASLYRSGPGKPRKVRGKDHLRFRMTVLTENGPISAIVKNSRERQILHRYNLALRKFRAGEEGFESALRKLEGETVAGLNLVTDVDTLIQLEMAGQLDFDTFYVAIGGRS